MIHSMTGFGKAQETMGKTVWSVEIRTLNSRYLDLSWKCPRVMVHKENDVREIIKKRMERGKVTVLLMAQTTDMKLTDFTIDQTVFNQYVAILREASRNAGLEGDVRLEHILEHEDIFIPNTQETGAETWKVIESCILKAADETNRMRLVEGAELGKDLMARVEAIALRLNKIEELSKTAVTDELEKLRGRLQVLLQKTNLDPQRLDTEIAVLSDKVDITEEFVRFRSHNKMFVELVGGKEVRVGRKLNFLLQEMGREANTMGSKSSQPEVIHTIVGIKEELEKMREQVQNVE